MTVPCSKCGGEFQRVHRTLFEKLRYAEAFACSQCAVRRYSDPVSFGKRREEATCPSCGTAKISLKFKLDALEPVLHSFASIFLRFLPGTRLFRCQYCRIYFYDRRALQSELLRGPNIL